MDHAHSFVIIMPELIIAVFALLLLIAGAVCGNRVSKQVGMLAILGMIVSGFMMLSPLRLDLLHGGNIPVFAFGNMFVDDPFARFVKVILLIASSLSILLSWSYLKQEKLEQPEYPVLILFATLGMMMMVSASDFMSLYVGLELQSLALYVMAAYQRDNLKSSESGLKYFVLGALSSGLILYGISLLYGYTGTTSFVSMAFAIREVSPAPIGVTIGLVFVCAAVAFKIAAVPFHMWTPDVYEGAPTPVTAFFSAAPKVAALA
ncbi:MAG: NADH-quinone oxidoreductase subunit N, partial [Alphaproteobacteria bacterium]